MSTRIQMRRTKGWRKPDGAVYVGRPTMWGNPFKIREAIHRGDPLWPYAIRDLTAASDHVWSRGPSGSALTLTSIAPLVVDHVVQMYSWWLLEQPHLMLRLDELAGRDLVCWCPVGTPCHADVLLETVAEVIE